MSKIEKLLRRILNTQKNVQFNDLVTLLTALGFERKRVSGSHQVFKHPDVNEIVTLQPDQNGKAKAYQVRQVLKMIEEYNLRVKSDQETDTQSSDKDGDK